MEVTDPLDGTWVNSPFAQSTLPILSTSDDTKDLEAGAKVSLRSEARLLDLLDMVQDPLNPPLIRIYVST